jgi:L,D-transpeptidase-like protein
LAETAPPLQFLRDKSHFMSNKGRMLRFSMLVLALFLCVCPVHADFVNDSRIIISVRDQKLMLLQNGARIATYPISTSKFGLGDNLGMMTTPLGVLQVAHKIGDNAPEGAVFHNRRWTGEVLKPNAPGRDPIVTRIIWLRGLEPINAHAYYRCIYIHGTPQERFIGRPASYGCIRMRSKDVAALYNQVPLGTVVQIIPDGLPKVAKGSPKPPVVIAQQAEATPEAWTASARSAQKPAALSSRKTSGVTLASLASAPSHLR